MATEYRSVSEDHENDVKRILQYSFVPERGPAPESYRIDWPPELYDLRGLFDDELVSVCKRYQLDALVRGKPTTVGGLGAVATTPERRREGLAAELVGNALSEFRREDIDLVALWPFDVAFHRRHGWGIATTPVRCELPPAELSMADESTGRYVRVTGEDWDRLRSVEEIRAESAGLALRRSRQWLQTRTLSDLAGSGVPYAYGYEVNGELRGYVVYTIDRDSGATSHEAKRRLRVRHLVSVDDEAHCGLLAFLSNQDSQVDTVEMSLPEGGDVLHRVRHPERVSTTVEVGPMIRLTSVVGALEAFPWPPGVNERFRLQVTDPLLESNDGDFSVRVADGTATVEPLEGSQSREGAARGGDDTFVTDIATLSQLYVGTYDPAEAERLGDCGIDDSLRGALSAAFPSEQIRFEAFF